MAAASIPVIHPNLATATRMRPWMYFIAACLLMIFAITYYKTTGKYSTVVFIIFTLVFLLIVAATKIRHAFFSNPATGLVLRFATAAVFSIIGFFFLMHDSGLFSILFFLCAVTYCYLGLAEKNIFSPQSVTATAACLLIPATLKARAFSWEKIEGIVQKDGCITIFLPKNRFLQIDTLPEVSIVQAVEWQETASGRLQAARETQTV
jgi:uncharacterized protein YqgC (DUF456 family)